MYNVTKLNMGEKSIQEERAVDFNVVECEKPIDMISDFTIANEL